MKRPKLMGILNLTPDSFSGDGILSPDAAMWRFEQLVEDGADIVDLGAESTRPNATALTAEQEWARLEPVLSCLGRRPSDGITLSIDTYHAETMAKALDCGVDIVNDVSGLRTDTAAQLLGAHSNQLVVMHALTLPVDPAIAWDEHTDAVDEIFRWKAAMLTRADQFGIDATRLIFDPGIGFGKSPAHSLALILRAAELIESGGRWLFGHSRKSFLGLFTGAPQAERDDLTLAFSAMLAHAGVSILRVHQVARHRALLNALCT